LPGATRPFEAYAVKPVTAWYVAAGVAEVAAGTRLGMNGSIVAAADPGRARPTPVAATTAAVRSPKRAASGDVTTPRR
jgi:hypothetical protein